MKTTKINKTKLSVPDRHRLKIAKQTPKMSDVGANIMGGMTKEEARNFIEGVEGKKRTQHLYRIWIGDENDRREEARVLAQNIDKALDWAKNKYIKKSAHKYVQEEGGDQYASLMVYKRNKEEPKDSDYAYTSWHVSVEEDDNEDPSFKTIYGTNEYYDLTGKKPKKAPDHDPEVARQSSVKNKVVLGTIKHLEKMKRMEGDPKGNITESIKNLKAQMK